jgi:hypothetical protein
MDPDVALRYARDAVRRLQAAEDREMNYNSNDVEQLVSSFAALDEWLGSGGFLPRVWASKRSARRTSGRKR